MSYEVKLQDRTAKVEVLSRNGNQLSVSVDGKEYQLDFVKIKEGNYSVIHNTVVNNIVLIPIDGVKKYLVNNFKTTFETEVIDAESRYLLSRRKGSGEDGEGIILAPIPGKVVKVLVEKGKPVAAGQTVVIISAMKMESEFKAAKDGIIVDVKVTEGQTVEARQPMVVIEYNSEK
ncbi:MAG TPA: acetyl-CoA carboxylase biotin carboxyl carrier protein subunit [Bacteroidales bacterium]|nr:acetyl-CoA carboxylase biotin carboxyl carrier protein subunit [Bacteroidales bacterium]